jgi:hypothetical protein
LATGHAISTAGAVVAHGSKHASPNKQLVKARTDLAEETLQVQALQANLQKQEEALKEKEKASRLRAQAEDQKLRDQAAKLQKEADAIELQRRLQVAVETAEKAKAAHLTKQASNMKRIAEDDTASLLTEAKAAELAWARKEQLLRENEAQQREDVRKERERQHAEQSLLLSELESNAARLEADDTRPYWLTLVRLYDDRANAAVLIAANTLIFICINQALAIARGLSPIFRLAFITCVVPAIYHFLPFFSCISITSSCRGLSLLFQNKAALEARALEEQVVDLNEERVKTCRQRENISKKMEEINVTTNNKLTDIEDKFRLDLETLSKEKEHTLSTCRERLIRMGLEVEQVAIKIGKSTELPPHWKGNWLLSTSKLEKYAVFPVDDATLSSLKSIFVVPHPEDLGFGRDVAKVPWTGPGVKKLQLAAAWRIENPSLFKSYLAAVDLVARDINKLKARPNLPSSPAVYTSLDRKLSDFRRITNELPLRTDVNETFLLHGTKPDTVLPSISNGLNERFCCGGLFGHGVYFAEDPAKNDQYTTVDADCTASSAALQSLHNALYAVKTQLQPQPQSQPQPQPHPGDVYYILLCRVVLGHFVSTREKHLDDEAGESIWAVPKRELAVIPGTSPPIHYHSLIAQSKRYLRDHGTGSSSSSSINCHLERHREFIQFNAQRVYPAYLLAYKRIKDGQPC